MREKVSSILIKVINVFKVMNEIRQAMLKYLTEIKRINKGKEEVLTNLVVCYLKKYWIVPLLLFCLIFRIWDVIGLIILVWYFETFVRYIFNLTKKQRRFINGYTYLLVKRKISIDEYFHKIPLEMLEEEQKTFTRINKIVIENRIECYVKQNNLPEVAVFILDRIVNSSETWKFNIWDLNNKSIVGNNSYLKILCIMKDGNSLADIRKNKNKIESSLRKKILLTEVKDKKAFSLTVILDEELKSYELDAKKLKKITSNNKILIGKSFTGKVINEWNNQANHIGVFGKSGSGKSEQIKNILYQVTNLKDFNYNELYLTSSSKIGDFTEFERSGALVVSGVSNQVKVFKHVLTVLEDREKLFFQEGVANLEEYNKKRSNNKLNQIILLADEYENSLNDLDKNVAKELEKLMVSILNVGRSSGCLVIIGGQNSLKGNIGVALDKLTIKFIGNNNVNVLNQIDTEVANYFKTLKKRAQGVFFYNTENLEDEKDRIYYGDSNYILVQTPYVKNIKSGNLPLLKGKEYKEMILNRNSELEITEDLY